MRISQSMLFDNFVANMNSSSYRLMELNNKASSQKEINKPSDDPIGTARVMGYRDSISALEQYKSNVDTAKGWLGLADESLMEVNNVLIRAKEITEQAATGSLSREQREMLSYEARQLYEQMINLANTRYEGKSIFGGHKVDEPAFEQAMTLSSNKDLPEEFTIQGKTTGTILVQFTTSAEVDDGVNINYRYSTDGGHEWKEATLAAGDTELDLDGVSVDLPAGYTVEANDPDDNNDTSGTWLWVRPTAEYMGDDADQYAVTAYAQNIEDSDVEVKGLFEKETVVRVDEIDGDDITYSYSEDGGSSWTTNQTTEEDGGETRFLLPGGRADVTGVEADDYNENDQIIIRPNSAAIDFEISPTERIQVNSVGKDIFGGIYKKPGQDNYTPAIEGGENVFETLGNLIGYLETNNQSGVQRTLEDIDLSLKNVNNELASIGSRENRLDIAESVLSGLTLNEKERMSKIEDADVAELMTKLANQQIIYEGVLRSSSNIMRMNLMNYI
ncbi:MAG: flagellar hook-associated protein FlgL [Desulfonatronovibrionaceae bacterium]